MYLVCVDPAMREDIAATAAAHRDLGPDYTDAMSEALVERIGREIDRRVDARLARPGPAAPAPRSTWVPAVIGVGSMACGVAATGIALFATATNINGRLENTISPLQIVLVVIIWTAIAVANVAYARHHR
jgi:hypothetical protein